MNDPADSVDGFVDHGVYEARMRCSDLTVHHGESVVRDDDRSDITGARIRRRNGKALTVKPGRLNRPQGLVQNVGLQWL